jgi:hypothetical protein
MVDRLGVDMRHHNVIAFRRHSPPRASISVDSFSWLGGLLGLRDDFTIPVHTFHQFPLRELMGRDFDPAIDARLLVYFGDRPVAAYYSVTENTTNDPDVRTLMPERLDEDVAVPVNPTRQ